MVSCVRQCVGLVCQRNTEQPLRHVGGGFCASRPSQVLSWNAPAASRIAVYDQLSISPLPSCFGRFNVHQNSKSFSELWLYDILSRDRRSLTMAASAPGSTEAAVKESEKCVESPSYSAPLLMTYLEGNSWLWTVNGVNILVDPILVGNLNFGIPFLYDAAKKSKLMKEFTLDDLPKLDCILITQGYDDHCHKSTLTAMVERFGEVPIIASPNTEPIIGKIGYKHVTYLEPRSTTMLGDIRIRASPGPVLGPPWQRPENGYFIEVPDPEFVIYYEPHCVFGNASLEKERADVIVTPVNKQVLPGYTLVSGQEDAVQLAEFLQPKYLVTMQNAELDSRGVLSLIVREEGTVDAFKEMLAKGAPNCQVLEPDCRVSFEVLVLEIKKN